MGDEGWGKGKGERGETHTHTHTHTWSSPSLVVVAVVVVASSTSFFPTSACDQRRCTPGSGGEHCFAAFISAANCAWAWAWAWASWASWVCWASWASLDDIIRGKEEGEESSFRLVPFGWLVGCGFVGYDSLPQLFVSYGNSIVSLHGYL